MGDVVYPRDPRPRQEFAACRPPIDAAHLTGFSGGLLHLRVKAGSPRRIVPVSLTVSAVQSNGSGAPVPVFVLYDALGGTGANVGTYNGSSIAPMAGWAPPAFTVFTTTISEIASHAEIANDGTTVIPGTSAVCVGELLIPPQGQATLDLSSRFALPPLGRSLVAGGPILSVVMTVPGGSWGFYIEELVWHEYG
jgi:hypothetical protein